MQPNTDTRTMDTSPAPGGITPDEEPVRRALAGDRDAFGALVSRYASVVHGLCSGVAGPGAAPELAHDAFVEAWLRLDTLRDPSRFAPWLRTLTLNVCRQWHRRRQRLRDAWVDIDPDELTAQDAAGDEHLDSLCAGLEHLSHDHRLALTLHYGQGLRYEQIASFLDVPLGTVMSRLHRARSTLRERMQQMPSTPNQAGRDADDAFRREVDAEIGVLLRLWEEESADPTPISDQPSPDQPADQPAPPTGASARRHERHRGVKSRTFSEAGKRLSQWVGDAPEIMRPVLATMDDALTKHASLLLLRAGGPAIGVAVACAFDDEATLRAMARRVLTEVLRPQVSQPLSENAGHLPLRLTATYVLDAILRSQVSDADKAALLVELIPGCEDEATLRLVSHMLHAWGEPALTGLAAAWRAAEDDAVAALYAEAMVRFGDGFLDTMVEALQPSSMAVARVLNALQIAVRHLDTGNLHGVGSSAAAPALERRVSGWLRRDDLDAARLERLADALQSLCGDERQTVRAAALPLLGALGGPAHLPSLHAALAAPDDATRHAAVNGVRAIDDRSSVPALIGLARDDDHLTVRRNALLALGQFGAVEACDLLLELVEEDDVQTAAVTALGELDDERARRRLRELTTHPDKKVARIAAGAVNRSPRGLPASELRRQRLARIRGADARPVLHRSVVGAIRNLPEDRPYPEVELTRRIGEICADYSTTRRELVMGSPGLMVRHENVYELSDRGRAVWRVERFLVEHNPLEPDA